MQTTKALQQVDLLTDLQPVAGTNRIRLTKGEDAENDRRWADNMRNLVQAKEYLCHIGEAIEWIESFLNERIDDYENKEDSIIGLEKTIHNGIVLAKLARKIHPGIIPNIVSSDAKHKFLRSNNINAFLTVLKEVELPSIFWFEFVDLYDSKNIPKVIYCIHALSHLLHSTITAPKIKNLSEEFNFSEDVLFAIQRNLDKNGLPMPNFNNLNSSLQKELGSGNSRPVFLFKPIEEPRVSNEISNLHKPNEIPQKKIIQFVRIDEGYEDSDSESKSSLSDDEELDHLTLRKEKNSISSLDSDRDDQSEMSGSDDDDDESREQILKAHYSRLDNENKVVGVQSYSQFHTSENNINNVQGKHQYHAYQSTVQNMQSRIRTAFRNHQMGEKKREYFPSADGFASKLQAMCRRYLAVKNKQYLIHEHTIHSSQVGGEGSFSAEYHERAYQQLKSEKNPSIGVVKSVLHMFNNNDVDFNEDLIIEDLRQKVVEYIHENNELDTIISMMDIQIALCLKNAMTADEVIKLNNKFFNINRRKQQQQKFSELLSSNSANNPYDLRGVDKAHREKLELYQQLVYLLQTEPTYLAQLMSITGSQIYGERKGQRKIDDTVLALFGYGTNSREECLLINLCKACISQEISNVKNIQEFMRGNYTFMKLVVQVNRGAKERKFFSDLFQNLIDKVLRDETLDLETNPLVIYRKCIQNEETATGQPSKRPYDISESEALQQRDVLRILSEHLTNLRNLTEDFLAAIVKRVDTMPYGMRVIARELRMVMEESFPNEEPENIIKILGNFIYYRYLSPVLTAPEQYIDLRHSVSPIQRANLAEISKVLQHISNSKLFDQGNKQLSALNSYIVSNSPRFVQWFLDLTDVEDPEQHFGLEDLYDYTNPQKPTVYVHPTDLYHIHQLLEENVDSIERQRSGVLHSILNDLGQAPPLPGNNVQLHLLRLELKDRKDSLSTETEGDVKKLLLDTKRLIILVIQVQSGNSLEEIFNTPITSADEEEWRIVREKAFPSEGTEKEIEMALRDKMFKFGYKAAAMDVKSLSFSELKTFAHRLHNHLMNHGIIPESPGYQSIINMIAVDITKKGERRKLRNTEIKKLQNILTHLGEKREFLISQGTAFKSYLDSSIESMANKRGQKKKFTLPFTRQYYHMKNLQKHGQVPRYSSYNYSAKALYDRGVIVDIPSVPKRLYSKITIILSMDRPGIITFEGYLPIQNISERVDIQYEELLNSQYEGNRTMPVLDGMVIVNVNLLLYLINRKFYRTA